MCTLKHTYDETSKKTPYSFISIMTFKLKKIETEKSPIPSMFATAHKRTHPIWTFVYKHLP